MQLELLATILTGVDRIQAGIILVKAPQEEAVTIIQEIIMSDEVTLDLLVTVGQAIHAHHPLGLHQVQ